MSFTSAVKVEALEAKAEELAYVLNDSNVFGTVEGKWLESEVRGFKNSIVKHANGESFFSYLELTYRYNCVRLIITTKIVDGEATFDEVNAYDHPVKSEQMDYEGLNKAIQETLSK